MTSRLASLAHRVPLYPMYKKFAEQRKARRMVRNFQVWTAEDWKRLDFYSRLIDPGDLVFDVGANLGNRSKIFTRLQARVVAVEPQTQCGDFLLSVFGDTPGFHLVRKALGRTPGQAEMFVSDAHTVSSLSREWVRSVSESGRFPEVRWDRKQKVQVDTLDNLIAEFGRPQFIKIDVEGFEDQVLAGLSTTVPALSLEFTPEYLQSTSACIDHLMSLGNYRFQLSLGESLELELGEWVSADAMKQTLAAVPAEAFGDVYASLVGRQ